MDFKKLMQYASANQMLTEKKHERKKQRQEEERNEELVRQVEEERRAARRLREARAKAEKKRREYKGLVAEAAQAKQTSSSSSNPSPTTTNATSSKTKTGDSSGTVKKVSNPASGSKPPPRSQTGAQTQKQKRQQPSDFVAPAASSNKGKAKAPVNFQDLLKIAQKKSGEVAEKEKNSKLIVRDSPPSRGTSPARPDGKSTPADARTCRGNSPVGKSLLERASCRVKKKRTHDEMEKAASSANDAPDNSPAETTVRSSKKPASKPTENGIHPKGTPSLQQPRGDLRSTGGASVAKDRPSQPKAPAQPPENRTRVSQSLPQARQRQRPRPGMDTLKTKSFYGAASAKLASAERPAWHTRHTPMKHTSAWVDEMSDYVQRKMVGGEEEEEFYSDDEEEDDMADFVASDEEEEEGEGLEDYSSAIRQIFGYDKRR